MCRGLAMTEAPHIDMRLRAGRLSNAQVRGFEAMRDSGGWAPPRRMELSGPDGGPIQTQDTGDLDFDLLSDEELIGLRDTLAKARKREP